MDHINEVAREFIEIAEEVLLAKQVYEDGWNAKEIIAHIVFYHEYYASVVKAIVDKEELPLINESLAKVNTESARNYSKLSRTELIKRFKAAHELLTRKISELGELTEIPYKRGGRIYNPEEYIDEIAGHIKRHTKDLKRKKII